MIEFLLILLALIWLVCGIIACGMYYHYFQTAFPFLAKSSRRTDGRMAYLTIPLGPIGLLSGLVNFAGNYGFMWPYSNAEEGEE